MKYLSIVLMLFSTAVLATTNPANTPYGSIVTRGEVTTQTSGSASQASGVAESQSINYSKSAQSQSVGFGVVLPKHVTKVDYTCQSKTDPACRVYYTQEDFNDMVADTERKVAELEQTIKEIERQKTEMIIRQIVAMVTISLLIVAVLINLFANRR